MPKPPAKECKSCGLPKPWGPNGEQPEGWKGALCPNHTRKYNKAAAREHRAEKRAYKERNPAVIDRDTASRILTANAAALAAKGSASVPGLVEDLGARGLADVPSAGGGGEVVEFGGDWIEVLRELVAEELATVDGESRVLRAS